MRTSVLVSALAAAGSTIAQSATSGSGSSSSATSASASGSSAASSASPLPAAPSGTSICDYYANALFGAANDTTEYTLLTALVNLAVTGAPANKSKNPLAMDVTGIVNDGQVNATGPTISLGKYFNGMLASSNRNGQAVSVNFLDGGGAEPLLAEKPANDQTSNQYFLFTHLYEYFGALLGCTSYGKGAFPAYSGNPSMYEVHKFMDLSYAEVSYFIQEVAYAALWFGVNPTDLATVGTALGTTFNAKCIPAAAVVPANVTALQAICLGEGCKESSPSNCSAYGTAAPVQPAPSNSSNVYTSKPTASPTSGGSGSGASGTGSATSSSSSGAAAATMIGNFGPVLGFAGLAAIAIGM